jgi:hypothetical protein
MFHFFEHEAHDATRLTTQFPAINVYTSSKFKVSPFEDEVPKTAVVFIEWDLGLVSLTYSWHLMANRFNFWLVPCLKLLVSPPSHG